MFNINNTFQPKHTYTNPNEMTIYEEPTMDLHKFMKNEYIHQMGINKHKWT